MEVEVESIEKYLNCLIYVKIPRGLKPVEKSQITSPVEIAYTTDDLVVIKLSLTDTREVKEGSYN